MRRHGQRRPGAGGQSESEDMIAIQEVTHARLEPRIAGCPGLFAARAKTGRTLKVEYAIGDIVLRFRGESLGAADLMVLCAIVALGGPGRQEPGESDASLIDALEVQPTELSAGSIVIETRSSRVLSECGLSDGGVQRAALIESLRRLSQLTVFARRGRQEVSMHLLSYAIETDSGALRVALSPRLAGAILGGRHTRIILHELRELGPAARVLYLRLVGWIDPGRCRRVGVDVIEEYLYSERGEGSTARERRRRARAAMREIERLEGWRVEIDAREKQYSISRPEAVSYVTKPVVCVTRTVGRMTAESAISV